MVTIRTPDQRLRVFISSTLGELAPERAAARAAIETLRLTPVLFELGARPHPPRELYRAYLAQSDVFVGIYWQRYGWVAPDMDVSGLEDEYLLCGDTPRLLYIKEPAPDREPALAALLERITAESLGSYRRFRDLDELSELIRDDLAILCSERFVATATPDQAARVHDCPTPAGPRLSAPATSLIGREREVAEVCDLLADEEIRLVTLSGPGGIGKTRLAIAAAEQIRAHGAVEVAAVPLAAIRDPDLVLSTIATSVGASLESGRPAFDALVDHFAGADHLLVLDNLEQVVDVAPRLADLLAACPRLRILATSRRLLRLRAEHEYPVPPLPVLPATSVGWVEELGRSPAVQLFVDRARAVQRDFALTDDNALAVAEICRRLDGLPLAVELAAARVRLLAPPSLLQRLTACLDALGTGPGDLPARQRTLRATIDWSTQLLDDDLRELLGTLAVFADGWDLPSAAQVCRRDEVAMLDALDELAGHSLVVVDSGAHEPRFRMLETVREYATELLAARADAAEVADRHTACVVALAERVDAGLRGHEQSYWLAHLEREHGNIRLAMRRLLDTGDVDDLATAAFLSRRLCLFWWLREHLTEAASWIEQGLLRVDELEPAARLDLLWTASATLMEVGAWERSRELAADALVLADDLDDQLMRGVCRLIHGFVTQDAEQLREAVAIFQADDELFLAGLALTGVGSCDLLAGDVERARAAHLECIEVARSIGNQRLHAQSTVLLAMDEMSAGDADRARSLLAEGAERFERLESAEGAALVLSGYAWLGLLEGDPLRAADALAAAQVLRERSGLVLWPLVRESEALLEATIREAVGPEAVERATDLARTRTRAESVIAAGTALTWPPGAVDLTDETTPTPAG